MIDFGIAENADVSLHDCRTNRILQEDRYITFCFPNGFYALRNVDVPEDYKAEMRCHLDRHSDGISVSVFRKTLFGKTVREDWPPEKFVSSVNSGKYEFEFVYTYRRYHGILFQGYLWTKRRPWWRECEIEFQTDEITYRWEEQPKNAE